MHSINGSQAQGLNAIPWPSHAEIASYAEQLWEQRGRPANRDIDIWLEAEEMLLIAKGYTQPHATRSARAKFSAKDEAHSQHKTETPAAPNQTSSNSPRANL